MTTRMSDEQQTPQLRVVGGGQPTDEELAALVAVIALRANTPTAAENSLRQPLTPWVASGLVKGTRTKI